MTVPQSRQPEQLTIPALTTTGIDRRAAFVDDHVRVGTIRPELPTPGPTGTSSGPLRLKPGAGGDGL